ncbi:MAG: hypothetical protein GXY08_03565, partial [Ruminococcus sp.]|nr:hypothetical protein [Ruminococcus sp.]
MKKLSIFAITAALVMLSGCGSVSSSSDSSSKPAATTAAATTTEAAKD